MEESKNVEGELYSLTSSYTKKKKKKSREAVLCVTLIWVAYATGVCKSQCGADNQTVRVQFVCMYRIWTHGLSNQPTG